jgi:hypothetical protein
MNDPALAIAQRAQDSSPDTIIPVTPDVFCMVSRATRINEIERMVTRRNDKHQNSSLKKNKCRTWSTSGIALRDPVN